MVKMKVSAPVTWHGGKARLARRIIAHFPPHQCYVDVFGGSASVLLAKEPSEVEIYNDVDGRLVNLFRVLRDPALLRKLYGALENTPYSRLEFELAQHATAEPVESARRFIVRQRQSHGGRGERWSFCVKDAHSGISSAVKRWQCGIRNLAEVHDRFKNVQIECADWRVIIDRYSAPETLMFLDPPYLPGTRVAGGYRYELSSEDHRELINRLLISRGMFVLCGYDHPLYTPLEQRGWKRLNYKVRAYGSDKRTRRVEYLWLSPSLVNYHCKGHIFLSPTQRMREGAYLVHQLRSASTTRKVLKARQKLEEIGAKPTVTAVSRAVKMSREHLARRYKHLFV
jgi:DNA adenine methylase